MKIEMKSPSDIVPYSENPRVNENAVDIVAKSIDKFGFQQPIVVDKYNVIIVGHTRWKAALKLGLKKVPVLVAKELSKSKAKEYRIADNRTNEIAEWQYDELFQELKELQQMDVDTDWLGFDSLEDINEKEKKQIDVDEYMQKSKAPKYEPTGEKPGVDDLYDDSKVISLKEQIRAADIPNDIKKFLNAAAERHRVFRYDKIAEFYAHSEKNIQELMESSALIIIDIKKALELGYVELYSEIEEQYAVDYDTE